MSNGYINYRGKSVYFIHTEGTER